MIFHFRLIPRKKNEKIFQKMQKKPTTVGPYLAQFAHFWAKQNFIHKVVLVNFFNSK